ncbi:MAG: NAD(P)H-dependent oxidoreductase [Lachnospiraceae bacterium]|nr:NAD(P)H-dependent oxidoreductase [Lachnospiraceae bacterium]
MKILVLNGSPKGEYSITLQTCLFIMRHFREHSFSVIHVGAQIKSLEKDFSKAKKMLEEADLILFSYPVYTFLVPAQLHRFIELMKEMQVNVKGKYAAQISTSKHFYDVTAHQFIMDNCKDLGLEYLEGLSADMDDLKSRKGQADALHFFQRILFDIAAERGQVPGPFAILKDVVIVADLAADDEKLKRMIDRFMENCTEEAKLVNIHDFPFKGGCISCFNCASTGTCIYKDGFQDLLRNEIQAGKAIVLAFTIKDHSMGYQFKLYDDRQFCNGHRTVTMGMPFGYLVSGKLSTERNLQLLMEARAEVGGNYLAGIASDEFDLDSSVDQMAASLSWAIENHYTKPANFYGVGGMKIFRDLIYEMQGLMREDYKFYKSHGQLDFPQKHKGRIAAMYLVGSLMKNQKLKAKMGNKMNEGMIAPYKKVLKKKDR